MDAMYRICIVTGDNKFTEKTLFGKCNQRRQLRKSELYIKYIKPDIKSKVERI
jgi:hypothetical protein